MADVRISQLPVAVTASSTDVLILNQGGIAKQITAQTLLSSFGLLSSTALYEYDYRTGGLPAAIMFARASEGTYHDSNGIVQVASAQTARFTYDPLTKAALGLLVERAHTNLTFAYDAYFGSGGFGVNASATSNVTASPDGTVTADKLVEAADTAQFHSGLRGDIAAGLADNQDFISSVYVKAAERTRLILAQQRKDSLNCEATVDLTAKTIVDTVTASVFYAVKTITEGQNGWFRITGQTNAVTGVSNVFPKLQPLDATGQAQYNGNGTSGFYVWGYDVGPGVYPTTLVRTTTASATRSAETAIESRNVGAEFTVVLKARTAMGVGTGITQYLWSSDDSTANERIYITRNANREIHVIVVDGGITQADMNMGQFGDNVSFSLAARFKINDCAVSMNGAPVVTDTSVTMPAMTVTRRGHDHTGANQWDGSIAYECVYPTGRTNADLIALST